MRLPLWENSSNEVAACNYATFIAVYNNSASYRRYENYAPLSVRPSVCPSHFAVETVRHIIKYFHKRISPCRLVVTSFDGLHVQCTYFSTCSAAGIWRTATLAWAKSTSPTVSFSKRIKGKLSTYSIQSVHSFIRVFIQTYFRQHGLQNT